MQHVSDLHPKFAVSMEVWQTSNLRPLRLGEEGKKEERGTNDRMKMYYVLSYYIGRP